MTGTPTYPLEGRFCSMEEYLSTSFQPDCDYVDGHVEKRNVGEWEHATVQKMLMRIFLAREEEWGVTIIQECRLQVAETRFRAPDTMILRAGQMVRRIVREAPLICIELISPEDTWSRVQSVLRDYLAMGVKHIWAFDPEERAAYRFDGDGLHPVRDQFVVEGACLVVRASEVFPQEAACTPPSPQKYAKYVG